MNQGWSLQAGQLLHAQRDGAGWVENRLRLYAEKTYFLMVSCLLANPRGLSSKDQLASQSDQPSRGEG